MLRASQKKRNLYAQSFPVSSAIHAGLHYLASTAMYFRLVSFCRCAERQQRQVITLSARHHPHGAGSSDSRCDGFYFGSESPAYQVELTNKYPSKALLLIAEQNTECIIGSAFCLIINNDEVRFSVNLDSLSRSGVRVNPDVLMLARNQKHG
ncbi:Uncharacterised protein [Citrobacter koseri]|uniref:DUF4154 domain-containing protein n=1 Tax=Citrobacter koseri TaxID=545 RepID=A0A2X2WLL7_CITKO|nr:Uncharacterised protein [Citrobacter koseri]